jgi:hypothetical protein
MVPSGTASIRCISAPHATHLMSVIRSYGGKCVRPPQSNSLNLSRLPFLFLRNHPQTARSHSAKGIRRKPRPPLCSQVLINVRFAPKADKRAEMSGCPLCAIRVLTRRSKEAPLFDHLVGGHEQLVRHSTPSRPRSHDDYASGGTQGMGAKSTTHSQCKWHIP